MTTIPYPNNPEHVDNLKTLELLKAQDFEGADASLEESLFHYGLVWRKLPDDNLLLVYRKSRNKFYRTVVPCDLDVVKEYDWFDWKGFCSFIGQDLETWLRENLPNKLGDMIHYSGVENVFGESYHEGFRIENTSDRIS